MATDVMPEGFVLDPPTVPEGFVLDQPSGEMPGGFVQDQPAPRNAAALPNYDQTMASISQRPDAMKVLTDDLTAKRSPWHAAIRASTYGPAVQGVKAMAVPFRRAESAVAAPLLEMQANGADPRRMWDAAVAGASGRNQAELGDVVRTTGVGGKWNEAIASGVGLAASAPIAGVVGKAGEMLGKFATRGAKIDNVIDKTFAKAVRPSVSGKATATQAESYLERTREAVKTIVQHKDALEFVDETGQKVNRLPESLNDFSSAIEQTKNIVFRQYDELAKRTGKQGATVNLHPIATEIEKISNNKAITALYPELEQYALAKAKGLRLQGEFTPDDAQNAIKMLNNSLEAFYKNPTPETATRAVIDAGIVNNLRKSLDDLIIQTTGEAYAPLKRAYGALKSIEKDVNRRMIVHGRQNPRGFFDLTDILSGGDMVKGLMNLDPAGFAKGVVQVGIKKWYKRINDPNLMIKGMFERVSRGALPAGPGARKIAAAGMASATTTRRKE